MNLRIYGLTKPAATVAPACIPVVPPKKSTVSPVKNEIRRSNHCGISTGSKRINIT